MTDGPTRVKDGYFALPLSRPIFWQKARAILGSRIWPMIQNYNRWDRETNMLKDSSNVSLKNYTWKRMELFDALAAQRVIAGPVLGMDEMSTNPQFEARNFLQMSLIRNIGFRVLLRKWVEVNGSSVQNSEVRKIPRLRRI
ncbi:MAG: hypothetical protein CM1200mP24_00410 [Gammaproteobacteria bacterium]|nr:MAG: hypothetical protein CM1200mP24_00410 [Gammaproteobacteria bacterium]